MIQIILVRKAVCEMCGDPKIFALDDPLPDRCWNCTSPNWVFGRPPITRETIRQGIHHTSTVLTKDALLSERMRKQVRVRWDKYRKEHPGTVPRRRKP
jgi:hypothetical protein